jgi:probable rRNA maturation factor
MAVWFHTHLRRWAVREHVLRNIALAILRETRRPGSHIGLTLVGTTRMRRLNTTYRRRHYPTDVLAFPAGPVCQENGALFLGDIVICLPTAVAQAPAFGNTPDQELLRLLIHGILHLLGYDHEISEQEARRMQRRERTIFHRLSPVPAILK